MIPIDRDAARVRVSKLVDNFRRNSVDYLKNAYNETQSRTDFITPLLEAFGWDVHNHKRLPSALREVLEEATVEVGEERLSKKPDYELRLARQRKIFVEAKKPAVRIDRDKASAFQVRRYGYSASLPIAILTNFHQLVIYDCVPKPSETDEAHVARLFLISYEEFEVRFDELWSILSRTSVYSGDFDRRFAVGVTRHGAQQFDDYFLSQVRNWREKLAIDINKNTPSLTPTELAYSVQLFLSRIIFLRICEDRDIEKYETLKSIGSGATFAGLVNLLKRADAFYDSGLFRLMEDERLGIRVSDGILRKIISELYYPHSPYTFAVVETKVLGEIYEQFLGEEITVIDGKVSIHQKPEVRESGGVVPTPRYIVDAIVDRTMMPLIKGKSPIEIGDFTVADICCGSGIFLIAAYERLLDHCLDWYVADGATKHSGRTIYEAGTDIWKLTFDERRRILVKHIRGVDIDHNAIEVARFSLFLKLIEDESAEDLADFVKTKKMPVLPLLELNVRCGNSLVSNEEWRAIYGEMMSPELIEKINPFSWANEFSNDFGKGGFDVIVENPPYVRIQNMTAYSPDEAKYYQEQGSPYSSAQKDNFDKYALFVERSLSLLKPSGKMGVIIPHKFMTIQAGKALRCLLSSGRYVEEIVHFGVQQVFGTGTSNYTCILLLNRAGTTGDVRLEKVGSLETWRYGQPGNMSTILWTTLTEESWQFADEATKTLFEHVRARCSKTLGSVAEIFVGVQTSADDVYIVRAESETSDQIMAHWNDRDWPIERSILRPCLHDVAIHPYSRPVANSWMIFPYKLVQKIKGKAEARLIQPKQFQKDFPGCFAYLKARRNELSGRSITGGSSEELQWYQYGRSQSLIKFDSPKIILPILSTEARYGYDDANTIVTGGGNGPYYLIRPNGTTNVSLNYLLAVLHHPLSEAFIRTNTSTFRGGYYSHGKQFIENLPIPEPDTNVMAEIDRLVTELVRINSEATVAKLPHQRIAKEREATMRRADIEARVSALFELSDSDVETVRSVPIPD